MIALHLPSFATVDEALDWLEGQGDVIRVTLYRGMDGMIRGSVLIVRGRA